jgi:hypothetical protein
MITISIFSSSLFFAVTLIILKAFDLRSGKQNVLVRIMSKMDNNSTVLIKNIKFRTFQFIQTLRYIFLVKTKNAIKTFFSGLFARVRDEYLEREKVFMGRKDISSKGAVSFFLKRIKDEKAFSSRGKIE